MMKTCVDIATDNATFTATEWRIIGITSIGHTLCHISELAFAAVIGAVMVEFQLGPDRAAALAVPGFILYGVGAIPAGLWTDRRGAREVMTAYFLLLTLAAIAVCTARTAWQVGTALALLGTAISLYHPAGLTMISQGCQRRGRAMGINGVAGSLGVALGPALGLLLASRGHWRATYAIVAGISLLGGLISLVIHRSLPARASSHVAASARKPSDVGAFAALPILFAAMLLGGINYRCLTTALPSYLGGVGASPSIGTAHSTHAAAVESSTEAPAGAPRSSNGTLVFVILALGGLGQLAGGQLADRQIPARVYTWAILVTIPCALLMAHSSSITLGLSAATLAVFMFAQQPLENVMIAQATPPHWRSTVYGLKFILAFGLASGGAYLTGWIWKHYGLARVFDTFAGIALLMSAFAAMYAWRCGRQHAAVVDEPATERAT
jgi:MFS family permease